jgi:glycerophosphoryl diester phosphodiesterase
MAALDWLTARPVAHRGLHDAAAGIIENTASAVRAAIAGGYAIEVDLQITADDEAVVHHDFDLGRLTEGKGPLAARTAPDLREVPFRKTSDRIMTLHELCELVDGRATMLLELKSNFSGDARLAKRTAEVIKDYKGPLAAMSFDPAVVSGLRHAAPWMTRGIVAERWYRHSEWAPLSRRQKFVMAHLLHMSETRPHFVAYHVKDLPAFAPLTARYAFGLPLLTWTVRSEGDRQRARKWASQMIFEGFKP